MRKSFVALLILVGAAASMTGLALAQQEGANGDLANKLVSPRAKAERGTAGARQSPARISATCQAVAPWHCDSIWIGHSVQTVVPGTPSTYSSSPWKVGRGLNRPGVPGAANNSGVWTWDNLAAGEDSLEGWWPMRRVYSITGGLTLADTDRPWWAVDFGNQGNYVLQKSHAVAGGGRTKGVVWY